MLRLAVQKIRNPLPFGVRAGTVSRQIPSSWAIFSRIPMVRKPCRVMQGDGGAIFREDRRLQGPEPIRVRCHDLLA